MRARGRAPDMTDQKNTILAIVLSALVLIAWQYFVGLPQMEKQKQEAQLKAQQQQQIQTPAQQAGQPAPSAPGGAQPQLSGQGAAPTITQQLTREAALKISPRVLIDTPRVRGSISLKGGQVDDLALTQYHETVDPTSPPIVLLSPLGSPHPFYAEFGWVGAAGAGTPVKTPDTNTIWTQQGGNALGVDRPVTLTWNNGEGLEFRRIISIDDKYLLAV